MSIFLRLDFSLFIIALFLSNLVSRGKGLCLRLHALLQLLLPLSYLILALVELVDSFGQFIYKCIGGLMGITKNVLFDVEIGVERVNWLVYHFIYLV